jgi:hypothetical protein
VEKGSVYGAGIGLLGRVPGRGRDRTSRVRYIGFPERRKCTNAGEVADFKNHGLAMGLVYEDDLTDWRGGFTRGQSSARRARMHATAIGFPENRPIYMAIDQDVVASGEFTTMLEYLRGAGTSLGGAQLTGVYGEADVIDRARDAGVASWYWQTAAWSRTRKTSCHLYQKIGSVLVGGISCDVNDVILPDWGQYSDGQGGLLVASAAEVQDIAKATAREVWNLVIPASGPNGEALNYRTFDYLLYSNIFANQIPTLLEAVTNDPDITKEALQGMMPSAEEIADQIRPGLTQEFLSGLASVLADSRVSDELAQGVLASMAQHLQQASLPQS